MIIQHQGILINFDKVAVVVPDPMGHSIGFLSDNSNNEVIAEFIFNTEEETKHAFSLLITAIINEVTFVELK